MLHSGKIEHKDSVGNKVCCTHCIKSAEFSEAGCITGLIHLARAQVGK
jgi:hypothetical protein